MPLARDKQKDYHRQWRADNAEKVRASQRKYSADHPEKAAARRRKGRYGITAEEFEALRSTQGDACAICGTKEPGAGHKSLLVDHCHSTQRVRGLLCHQCNVGLGNFKDSPERLTAAIQYLAT